MYLLRDYIGLVFCTLILTFYLKSTKAGVDVVVKRSLRTSKLEVIISGGCAKFRSVAFL